MGEPGNKDRAECCFFGKSSIERCGRSGALQGGEDQMRGEKKGGCRGLEKPMEVCKKKLKVQSSAASFRGTSANNHTDGGMTEEHDNCQNNKHWKKTKNKNRKLEFKDNVNTLYFDTIGHYLKNESTFVVLSEPHSSWLFIMTWSKDQMCILCSMYYNILPNAKPFGNGGSWF